ncbi:MAG: NHL repeat-containing protein [Oscillospiraceae bacterium]|nr:NHL repeat-containing protein [Oscillospiraceae bacterium]
MKKFLRCAFVTLVLAALLVAPASAFNYWDSGYILAPNGKTRMAMPKPYTVEKVVSVIEGSEDDSLDTPKDLFLAPNGDYYIADTGNMRVVRLNSNLEYVAEYNAGGEFITPEGIFVTDEGDMYVADSSASKIFHLDPNGEWVEDFVMPVSELLYKVTSFTPTKVAINPINNYLYIVQGKQFMTINAVNDFKGYVGANKVKFDPLNFLMRTFATDEQKDQMEKVEPDVYYNFHIAKNGKIYATGANDSKRICVFNSTGNNTYPTGNYGESIFEDDGREWEPIFVDICVDENEFITVLEQNTRCLYQYDYQGNLICIFGGTGATEGYFDLPSAIVYAGNGRLVSLDSLQGRLQVFTPTDFIITVQKAIIAYSEGKYDESLELWNEIKESNASYNLAREFIGKIQMKQGKYTEVLDDFKQSENKESYGKAFEQIRYAFIQKYFYFIVAGLIALIIGLVLAMKAIRKYVRKIKKEFWDKLEG